MKDAACSPDTADLFHPDMRLRHEGPPYRKYRRALEAAKTICRACPVIEACREHARNEMFGVWGGLSAEERGFWGVTYTPSQRQPHPAFEVVFT